MLHSLIAIGLTLHGLIHLIGFVVNWNLVSLTDIPYTTTVLAGKINGWGTGNTVVRGSYTFHQIKKDHLWD